MYKLSDYNVYWNSLGNDASDSMPTGNGDIGINVWTEQNGDVLFYIGKTDSWDENGRLLKICRVRLSFEPNMFIDNKNFEHALYLEESYIKLSNDNINLKIWVDANNPIIRIEGRTKNQINLKVKIESWRTNNKILTLKYIQDGRLASDSAGSHSERGLFEAGQCPIISADKFIKNDRCIAIYHRNKDSIWKQEMKHQGFGDYVETVEDPLLNLTSGALFYGEHFFIQDKLLVLNNKDKFTLNIILKTEKSDTEKIWFNNIQNLLKDCLKECTESAFKRHKEYWKNFWKRSYIYITGPEKDIAETDTITRMWHLHRYVIACAGRGNSPLKFNGSIFNVDGFIKAKNQYIENNYDADFRGWGGCYWFQNQRQVYWPLLASGDYDCIKPFFEMYYKALPFAKYQTKKWFNHNGVFFPETMYFWGGINRTDYGNIPACKKENLSEISSGYIKRYWQGGLELSFMMIEYYLHTKDKEYFINVLYKVIREILTFYDLHYKMNAEGKMIIQPAQCLETIFNATDPLPEIAGLQAITEKLLRLSNLLPEEDIQWIKKIRDKIPGYEYGKINNKECILPGRELDITTYNTENISMYAVFPYKRFGLFEDKLDVAKNTYYERTFTCQYKCWHNDNVFAAYLGLIDEARNNLANRFSLHEGYRFPVFYVEGDWVPDHDNGGVAQQTIQSMLVQNKGDKVLLFPTFPSEWNAEFKLHLDNGKIIHAKKVGKNINFDMQKNENIINWS